MFPCTRWQLQTVDQSSKNTDITLASGCASLFSFNTGRWASLSTLFHCSIAISQFFCQFNWKQLCSYLLFVTFQAANCLCPAQSSLQRTTAPETLPLLPPPLISVITKDCVPVKSISKCMFYSIDNLFSWFAFFPKFIPPIINSYKLPARQLGPTEHSKAPVLNAIHTVSELSAVCLPALEILLLLIKSFQTCIYGWKLIIVPESFSFFLLSQTSVTYPCGAENHTFVFSSFKQTNSRFTLYFSPDKRADARGGRLERSKKRLPS